MKTETVDPAVIAERRKLIKQDAPCVGCGTSRAECDEERKNNDDPTAPEWFGCCAMGTGMAPCRHIEDPADLRRLLDEIAAGRVRPAGEILAERAERERKREERRKARGPITGSIYEQGEWWRQKTGEWIRVADMAPSHRANTAAMLLRKATAIAIRRGFAELAVYADAPDDVVDSWLHEDGQRLDDPEAWMRGTALYRALTAEAAQ